MKKRTLQKFFGFLMEVFYIFHLFSIFFIIFPRFCFSPGLDRPPARQRQRAVTTEPAARAVGPSGGLDWISVVDLGPQILEASVAVGETLLNISDLAEKPEPFFSFCIDIRISTISRNLTLTTFQAFQNTPFLHKRDE